MQPTDDDPSRHLTPRQARKQFLDVKHGQVKESSWRTYKFPTEHLADYAHEHGADRIGDIDNYLIEQWKQTRRSEDINLMTLMNNVKTIRVWIRWCESAGLIEPGVADRISVPDVPEDQQVDDDILRADEADHILTYLETYEYGSREHALFQLMWHTGCRISGARALDVSDFKPASGPDEPSIIEFRHRRETDTPLKNNNKSERNVSINDETTEVLNAYVSLKRHEIPDEYGRHPLFTTRSQRLSRQRAYKNFVALTRPCVTTDSCPHDKQIDSCQAANQVKKAYECPSSLSLHPIRRGAITHHVNQQWPKEKVSERCDVSLKVLNKHYDGRKKEESREGRKQFLDNL